MSEKQKFDGPEYEAVRHILSAPLIDEQTRPYIGDGTVDWVGLESETRTMSSGGRFLVSVASDLWSAEKQTGLSELPRRLDAHNFERVLAALRIARGPWRRTDPGRRGDRRVGAHPIGREGSAGDTRPQILPLFL